jgi:tRNA-binding protein
MELTRADFEKIDMRVGTILEATEFPAARNAAYKLLIDFGPLGIKKSSAQITLRYSLNDLVGKQVIAVVNVPHKQIGKFMSVCLVLGVVGNDNEVVLLKPDQQSQNGDRIL